MDSTLQLLKLLADETRLKILYLLKHKSLCVCEIEALLPISQSTISIQLKKLAQASLVRGVKEGKWVMYHYQASESDILDPILNQLDQDIQMVHLREKAKIVCRYQLCMEK